MPHYLYIPLYQGRRFHWKQGVFNLEFKWITDIQGARIYASFINYLDMFSALCLVWGRDIFRKGPPWVKLVSGKRQPYNAMKCDTVSFLAIISVCWDRFFSGHWGAPPSKDRPINGGASQGNILNPVLKPINLMTKGVMSATSSFVFPTGLPSPPVMFIPFGTIDFVSQFQSWPS